MSATARCSPTCSSATWPTTSCRPGSASSSGATTSAIGRACRGRRRSGTVVVERVVDFVVVVAIASAAIIVLSVRGIVASAVLVGIAVAGLLAAAVAIGIAAHRLPGAERIAAAAERWPRVRDLASKLRGGLAVAGRPRTLAEALVLSVDRLGRHRPGVRGGGPGDRHRADDRSGGPARLGRRAGHRDPGRPGQPRHVRACRGADRQGRRGRPIPRRSPWLCWPTPGSSPSRRSGGLISLARLGWRRD